MRLACVRTESQAGSLRYFSSSRYFPDGEAGSPCCRARLGRACRHQPLSNCFRHWTCHPFPLDHPGAAVSIARDPREPVDHHNRGHPLLPGIFRRQNSMARFCLGRGPHCHSPDRRRLACNSGARPSKSRIHRNRGIARGWHQSRRAHCKGSYASRHQHVTGTVFEHWIKPRRRCCCVGRARSCSFQSPACFVDLHPRNSCLSLLCAEAFARCESENLAGLEKIEWTT